MAADGGERMALRSRKLTVTIAVVLLVLLIGALVVFGLAQALAQDNLNSQPSTSRMAADGSGSFHAKKPLKKQLWAVVNRNNGRVARGQGALDANRLGRGAYEVLFDRNVRRCAYTATIGLSGSEGFEAPGEITVVGRVGTPNGVFITTHNSSGRLANRGFHLVVNCP
jgi:hypothetical protein